MEGCKEEAGKAGDGLWKWLWWKILGDWAGMVMGRRAGSRYMSKVEPTGLDGGL